MIDHHPEQHGYNAVFKDIREDFGSTCTILTEHLRAVDATISERTATAMLYAIKSDTLFFNRQANRCDIEAFSYLYPLADATLIRQMEGAEITMERLQFVVKATERGKMVDQIFSVFLGEVPRDDVIPYVADFFLQLENVRWTLVSGIVNGSFVMSVRNLGYSRNAGDFVRRYFVDIGSAGGHRAMAKAVVPLARVQSDDSARSTTEDDAKDHRAAAGVPARDARRRRREKEPVVKPLVPKLITRPTPFPNHRLDELPVGVLIAPVDSSRGSGSDPTAHRNARRSRTGRQGCARAESQRLPRNRVAVGAHGVADRRRPRPPTAPPPAAIRASRQAC